MKDRVLLISSDGTLAQRVQTLVQRLSVDLEWRHEFEPPLQWPAAAMVLLDEDCLPEEMPESMADPIADETAVPAPGDPGAVLEASAGDRPAAAAGGEAPEPRPPAATLLLASQGMRRGMSLQVGFRDVLYKDHRLSHLPWVLQEHLNALRLRRVRQRQESEAEADLDPTVFSIRHEINNPLSGILGNAELALATRSKMPAEVRERLERIVQLAMQMRELLRSPAASELAAGGDPQRAGHAHSGALLMDGAGHDSNYSRLG